MRILELDLLNKIFFILDDLIGNEFFDELEYIEWRKYEESL